MTSIQRAPEPRAFTTADDYIGDRVATEIRRRRMTQTETARSLGLGQSSLSKKLHGERGWSADEILVVSRFFDIPLDELLPGPEYVPAPWGGGPTGGVNDDDTASGYLGVTANHAGGEAGDTSRYLPTADTVVTPFERRRGAVVVPLFPVDAQVAA